MCADQTGLPVLFDDDGDYSGQLIRGTRLKFIDKIWTATDGTPIDEDEDRFLVVGTGHALQRWVDGLPQVITERPLPDAKELNKAIPKSEWLLGKFSGQPEPPWKHVWYVYLVRVSDGTVLTHINSTAGIRVAYTRLKERIKTISLLRGASVLPMVKLPWAMMPSDFGPRPRQDFAIDQWRDFGGNQPAQIEPPKQTEQIGRPVSEPSLREEMGDQIKY